MRRRVLGLALTALMLYGVAPAVADVLGGWHDLHRISPAWWVAVAVTQVAGWVCLWVVQRVALNRPPWFPVAVSQLASGAFGRVVPGGAAAAAGLQYRMLAQAGLPSAGVATGLTAGSLLLLGALCALPILAVPALIAGRRIPTHLLEAGGVSLVVFAGLFAIGAVLLSSDRAIRWVGRAAAAALRRLRPKHPARDDLADQLAVERDLVRTTLGRRWPEALAAAEGRWLLDFLTLQAALTAVDARPRLSLALLAYCAAQLLAQVPITPGGLGVVEAGLTGTLALAGVPAGAAAVATLTYRLASYWLTLPAGLVAWLWHRRRYRESPDELPGPAEAPA